MTPEKFLKRHGFPNTPAGDRMLANLQRVIATAIANNEKRTDEDQD